MVLVVDVLQHQPMLAEQPSLPHSPADRTRVVSLASRAAAPRSPSGVQLRGPALRRNLGVIDLDWVAVLSRVLWGRILAMGWALARLPVGHVYGLRGGYRLGLLALPSMRSVRETDAVRQANISVSR